MCVASSTLNSCRSSVAEPPGSSAKWEAAIAQFEAEDMERPPTAGGVMFLGSSSIRLWDTKKCFPDLLVVNRGFGGSQIADSRFYAHRIVVPHKPRVIVFYAGDNDIAAGKTADTVLADYQAFVEEIHRHLPKARIVFIAIKPSIARWHLIETIRAANRLVRELSSRNPLLEFVDVFAPMIGSDGRPRKKLFAKDGLHLNDSGYQLWTTLVAPYVMVQDVNDRQLHCLPGDLRTR